MIKKNRKEKSKVINKAQKTPNKNNYTSQFINDNKVVIQIPNKEVKDESLSSILTIGIMFAFQEMGIKDIDITIIPRPQYNSIRVIGTVGNKAQLAVYDVAGRKLMASKLTDANINDIEMSGFKSGVYVIHISSSTHKMSKKISWIQN